MVPEFRPAVVGLERADSLAFDLHKWMVMPFDIGALLVRDRVAHLAPFTSPNAPYVEEVVGGAGEVEVDYGRAGPQLSRNFRALKVWLSLKAFGPGPFIELVRRNTKQARYLATAVTGHPELELMAPLRLNVVCFRYWREGMDDAKSNRVNRAVLLALHQSGIAVSITYDPAGAVRHPGRAHQPPHHA